MRFPKATWRGPVPNEEHGGIVYPIRGLVLHIEQGSESSADNWFHNAGAQASAHFGNPKTGSLQQWVDSDDEAWAEMAGNSRWISVEHEGFSGQTLTASQVENDAQLLAWLHKLYGFPLIPTDNPNGTGLGWHGMGGAAWGGHDLCPGEPIKAQRAEIIARANAILKPPPVLSRALLALKARLSPSRGIVKHAGGDAFVDKKSMTWQGIPDEPTLAHLYQVGAKNTTVTASFWVKSKQVAW